MNFVSGNQGGVWRRIAARPSIASLQRWLAVAVVVFTVSSAGGLLVFIVDRNAVVNTTLQAQVQMAAMQMSKEFQALDHVVDLFALGHPGVGGDDVRLKYDILYSRVDMMAQGIFGRALEQDSDVFDLLRSIAADVVELEGDVARLHDDDPAGIRLLDARLGSLDRPIAIFETAIHQLHVAALAEVRAQTLYRYLLLASLLGGLLASVGAFIILLLKQFRMVRAARDNLQKLLEELRLAKEEAEAASRAKSRFLANMSHELRTPLNAILGFSEIIRDASFGRDAHERYREYAGDINSSGSHLLSLVNDVLDLSRIEAGKFQLDEEVVGVDNMVRSCLAVVKATALGKRIALYRDGAPVEQSLLADRRALKQMLFNVLSNAVKFTPSGGSVRIGIEQLNQDGLEFVIHDSGFGMTPEEIEVAVTPFSQLNDLLARQYGGAGLGLSITKSLIELHQGELIIESRKGSGTTIRLRFPQHRVVADVAQAAAGA